MTEQTKKKATIHDSLGANPTTEKNIPEDVEWIDDASRVVNSGVVGGKL